MKTAWLALAFVLLIQPAFSIQVVDQIVFHTNPADVAALERAFDEQQATPQVSAATISRSSGTVLCAQTALKNNKKLGRAIDQAISQAASKWKVDPCLVCGLIQAESHFNPNAGSPVGAQGLTQLMPATAQGSCHLSSEKIRSIPENVECGTRYISTQTNTFKDVSLGLAAYNCGPGCVWKRIRNYLHSFEAIKSSLPQETENYVPRVLANAKRFKANGLC